ncbi:MAG: hypothetical protein PHY34_06205 [Patescibacteria group bacterium]|nr:hypothetical protein [Patescibacteria group bacterium]MDD5715789.1 hypothetical protein [Patescibacteria group bacterium]
MKTFLLLCLMSVGTLFVWVRPASADVGPPPVFTQGGIVQTDAEATNVTMASEDVVLKYSQPQQDDMWGEVMPVHVTATFIMRNTGTEAETLRVYFPSSDSAFVSGFEGGYGTVENFTVNGRVLGEGDLGHLTANIDNEEQSIRVYQWQETFLPGEDTTLAISYDAKSGKDYEVYYLTYVLGTGRGWKGPIGSGTVKFEMPETLTDYSVVEDVPLVGENVLPFTVVGNTITVPLKDYEPESDTVIVLGVYDFDLVNQAENLKGNAASFGNTLELASALRALSGGPHCAFCTGKAADMALSDYSEALEQASSQDELDRTLASFMFGDAQLYDGWTPPTPSETKALFSFPDCAADDTNCRYDLYFDRGGLGDTPLTIDYATHTLKHEDFLELYVSKIRPYDSATADAIERYIQDAPKAYEWQNAQYSPPEAAEEGTNVNSAIINTNTITNSVTTNTSAASVSGRHHAAQRNWQLVGLGVMVVALALGYFVVKGKI